MGPQPDDVSDPVVRVDGDNRREVNLLEAIRRRFAPFDGVDLELPPRELVEDIRSAVVSAEARRPSPSLLLA
jgi:hypothetical protein